jgi:UDP-glucose 4-epimerase
VNVKDVARGHVLALEKGKKGEIYILGGHNIFLSEFFDILSRITGLRKPLKLPRRLSSFLGQIVGFILELWAKISGNPPLITRAQARASLLNLFYSSEKAIRELGYTISPIEDAVKDAIRYFLEKGMVKRKIKEKIEGKI